MTEKYRKNKTKTSFLFIVKIIYKHNTSRARHVTWMVNKYESMRVSFLDTPFPLDKFHLSNPCKMSCCFSQ